MQAEQPTGLALIGAAALAALALISPVAVGPLWTLATLLALAALLRPAWARRVLLLFGATLLTLVAFEVGLRFTVGQEWASLHRLDERRLHTLIAGASKRFPPHAGQWRRLRRRPDQRRRLPRRAVAEGGRGLSCGGLRRLVHRGSIRHPRGDLRRAAVNRNSRGRSLVRSRRSTPASWPTAPTRSVSRWRSSCRSFGRTWRW